MEENDDMVSWVAGMRDPDPDVRIRHSGKWINWEELPAAAIPILVAALDDENLWVRGEAAGTLCVHEKCEDLAWKAFRSILTSDDDDAVVGALSILSDFVSAAPVATELLMLLRHPNAETRQFAVQAFRMGIQEPELGSRSKQELEGSFPGIMNALAPIQQLLRDPVQKVRIEAAHCLYCFGPLAKGSLPVFREWSKSSDEELREIGVQGIRYMTGK
jgi:HEAT repeat protein